MKYCHTSCSLSSTAHSGQVTCVAASPHKDSVFLSCGEVRYSHFYLSHPLTTPKPFRPKSSMDSFCSAAVFGLWSPFSIPSSRTVEFYCGIPAVQSQHHRWVSLRAGGGMMVLGTPLEESFLGQSQRQSYQMPSHWHEWSNCFLSRWGSCCAMGPKRKG